MSLKIQLQHCLIALERWGECAAEEDEFTPREPHIQCGVLISLTVRGLVNRPGSIANWRELALAERQRVTVFPVFVALSLGQRNNLLLLYYSLFFLLTSFLPSSLSSSCYYRNSWLLKVLRKSEVWRPSLKWHISISHIKTQGTLQKRQKNAGARVCGGVLWIAGFQTRHANPAEVTEVVIIFRRSAQDWAINIPSRRSLGLIKLCLSLRMDSYWQWGRYFLQWYVYWEVVHDLINNHSPTHIRNIKLIKSTHTHTHRK